MVLVIAAEYNLECWQLNYNTAFLNTDVAEEVYVKMAPAYEELDDNGVPMIVKLLKSLYSLCQSPTMWWGMIHEHVVEIDFESLKSDPYVYIYSEDGFIFILTLYVDDVLLFGNDIVMLIKLIKQKRMGRFSMTDMGEVSLVLGMGVTRDSEKGTVIITQVNHTKSLLERYGKGNCSPTDNPGVGSELSLDQPGEKLLNNEDKQRFQAITGSVMYLGQMTRDDILYSVNQLARAMSKPSKAHMTAAKHLFSTWPGQWTSSSRTQARRFQANDVFGRELEQQPGQRQVSILVPGLPGQRSDQLQGGAARPNGAVHDGGKARGRNADKKGGDVLLQYDEGAGIWHAL